MRMNELQLSTLMTQNHNEGKRLHIYIKHGTIHVKFKNNSNTTALAGVAQWIEHEPVWNHRVAGLIPSQGTSLGCRPGPQLRVRDRQQHIDVSLSLKINKI